RTDHTIDIGVGRVLTRAEINRAEHTETDERQHIAAATDAIGSAHERDITAAEERRTSRSAKASNRTAISGSCWATISGTDDPDRPSRHDRTAITRTDATTNRPSVHTRRSEIRVDHRS